MLDTHNIFMTKTTMTKQVVTTDACFEIITAYEVL